MQTTEPTRPEAREAGPAPDSSDGSLSGLLWRLAQGLDGVQGIVIADPHGLAVASLVRGKGAASAAAMATLLSTAAQRVVQGLGASEPTSIVIEAPELTVLVRFLGSGFTLLAAFGRDVDLGLARLELARYAPALRELLDAFR